MGKKIKLLLTALNNGSRKLQNSVSELSQTVMLSFLFYFLPCGVILSAKRREEQ